MSIYSLAENINQNIPSKHSIGSKRLREVELIAKVSSNECDWYVVCGNKQRTNALINDWIFYGIVDARTSPPVHCSFKLPAKVFSPNIDNENTLTWDRDFNTKDWISYLDENGLSFHPAAGPIMRSNIRGNQYFEPEHFDSLLVNDSYQMSDGRDGVLNITCISIEGNIARFIYTHDCREFEIRLPIDELSDRLYRVNGHDSSSENAHSIRVYLKQDQLQTGSVYCVDDGKGRSRVSVYIGVDEASEQHLFSTCDYFPDDVLAFNQDNKSIAYRLENQFDWDAKQLGLKRLDDEIYSSGPDELAMN